MAAVVIVALCGAGCGDAAPGVPPGPGVPAELARSRAAGISDLSYRLEFVVPDDRGEAVLGEATIMFEWEGRGPLALDFAAETAQVRDAEANGESFDHAPVDEHILVPRAALRDGRNVIRVSFIAGDGSLNRTDEFLYTLFVPDRARWAFPVFDQPDLKARFSLTLDLPSDWMGVA